MTIDSGAVDTVIPPPQSIPHEPLRERPASKEKIYYLAANNSKIPSRGRKAYTGTPKMGAR